MHGWNGDLAEKFDHQLYVFDMLQTAEVSLDQACGKGVRTMRKLSAASKHWGHLRWAPAALHRNSRSHTTLRRCPLTMSCLASTSAPRGMLVLDQRPNLPAGLRAPDIAVQEDCSLPHETLRPALAAEAASTRQRRTIIVSGSELSSRATELSRGWNARPKALQGAPAVEVGSYGQAGPAKTLGVCRSSAAPGNACCQWAMGP